MTTTPNRTNYVGMYEAHLKAEEDNIAKLENLLTEARTRRTRVLLQLEYAKASALRRLWLRMRGRKPR